MVIDFGNWSCGSVACVVPKLQRREHTVAGQGEDQDQDTSLRSPHSPAGTGWSSWQVTSPPPMQLYRRGALASRARSPGCRPPQTGGAVDMVLPLLTVGLALLRGLQAHESYEESWKDAVEARPQGYEGCVLPGVGAGVRVAYTGWPGPGRGPVSQAVSGFLRGAGRQPPGGQTLLLWVCAQDTGRRRVHRGPQVSPAHRRREPRPLADHTQTGGGHRGGAGHHSRGLVNEPQGESAGCGGSLWGKSRGRCGGCGPQHGLGRSPKFLQKE